MKKIININLSGRVIPIEDAAYESLQRYIESLRRYFAAEEGRDEIINDIESRIAELMSDKVKKGAAAVTEEDMETIINTMGRVEDFEEVEAAADTANAGAGASAAAPDESAFTRITGRRPRGRLYRNTSDRFLAGVCSGLANYFDIDPTIVRIIFLVLAFGGGASIFVYILLWIFVPKKLLMPSPAKRFFRNPDERILGGVAGGIAAYFKWDVWTVRLVFLAPFLLNLLLGILNAIFSFHSGRTIPEFLFGSFTFTFFLTYVVLWIILPLAISPFEKMEMRGENVDVKRIRENVKTEMENFRAETDTLAEEVKASTKAFAARASEYAQPVASHAGNVLVTILKVIVLLFAGFLALMFFVALTALIFTGVGDILNNFILEGRAQKVLGWGGLLLLFGVPFVALVTWLIRRVMKVRSSNRYLGWVFGGLWLIGILMSVAFAASMARSFQYAGRVTENVEAATVRNRMIVRVTQPMIEYSGYYSFLNPDNGDGFDINNDSMKLSNVRIQVEKSLDSQYHVVVEKRSLGGSRSIAQLRAQRLEYLTQVQDSFLNLGNGYAIGRAQKWRNQHIVVRIQVPVGRKLRFEESVSERLNGRQVHIDVHGDRRWRRNWESDWDDDYGNNTDSWKSNIDYVMSPDGELVDPNAPKDTDATGTPEAPENSKPGIYEYHRRSGDSVQPRSTTPAAPQSPANNAPAAPGTEPEPEARVNYTPTPMLATLSLVAS
ncbi:PspC domain-containing protein [Flaviaesturariibacter terrae]